MMFTPSCSRLENRERSCAKRPKQCEPFSLRKERTGLREASPVREGHDPNRYRRSTHKREPSPNVPLLLSAGRCVCQREWQGTLRQIRNAGIIVPTYRTANKIMQGINPMSGQSSGSVEHTKGRACCGAITIGIPPSLDSQSNCSGIITSPPQESHRHQRGILDRMHKAIFCVVALLNLVACLLPIQSAIIKREDIVQCFSQTGLAWNLAQGRF